MSTAGFGGAVGGPVLTGAAPTGPAGAARRRVRFPKAAAAARWIILILCGIYFIGPILATISYTVKNPLGGISFSAYGDIFANPATGQVGFLDSLVYSLEISVITIVVTIALMLPTQLLLQLRLPRWRGLVEVITLLPLVFPPVVLVVGVDDTYTWIGQDKGSPLYEVVSWIRDPAHPLVLALLYVVLALPFVYRTLDAGIRSIDSRTLVEASRNLGAGWLTTLFRVVMPCLRTAIVNAAFMCFALVMGEYTISSILVYTKPFPVWLAQLPTIDGQVQAAVSVFSLLLVEVLLLAVGALNWRFSAEKKG
ncbi:MAG TPA: ABC transporter permease subunit [Pseudonocardiaceae bacterium]